MTVPPFTLRSSLFTLTNTPLALPLGGSRPSLASPNGSSPSVAYSVPCPCASTSCKSLTVTAAVEPSPTPVTTMGSWSGGGMSTHWLGCGARMCTTPAGETISSGGASSFCPFRPYALSYPEVPRDASFALFPSVAMRDMRPGLGWAFSGTAASTLAAAVSWSSSSSMRARVDSGGFVSSSALVALVSCSVALVSCSVALVSSVDLVFSSVDLVSSSVDLVSSWVALVSSSVVAGASSVVAPLSA